MRNLSDFLASFSIPEPDNIVIMDGGGGLAIRTQNDSLPRETRDFLASFSIPEPDNIVITGGSDDLALRD